VIVFRKPAIQAYCWLGMAAVTSMFVVAAFLPRPGAGTLAAAFVFAAGAYVLWLIGAHSAVRFTSSAVIVDNLLIRHVLPWSELSDITVDYGLEFRPNNKRRIRSIMYGGSVIGVILGYRSIRGVAVRMNSARRDFENRTDPTAASATYKRAVSFSPWPPLAILAVMEIIASVSLIAR
jgi:hypothetical protein